MKTSDQIVKEALKENDLVVCAREILALEEEGILPQDALLRFVGRKISTELNYTATTGLRFAMMAVKKIALNKFIQEAKP